LTACFCIISTTIQKSGDDLPRFYYIGTDLLLFNIAVAANNNIVLAMARAGQQCDFGNRSAFPGLGGRFQQDGLRSGEPTRETTASCHIGRRHGEMSASEAFAGIWVAAERKLSCSSASNTQAFALRWYDIDAFGAKPLTVPLPIFRRSATQASAASLVNRRKVNR
jgi:hypothetical protein